MCLHSPSHWCIKLPQQPEGTISILSCTSLLTPLLEPWLTWTFLRIATLGTNSNAPCLWNDSQLYNPAVISTKIINQITLTHCGSPSLMASRMCLMPSSCGKHTERVRQGPSRHTWWRFSLWTLIKLPKTQTIPSPYCFPVLPICQSKKHYHVRPVKQSKC